MELKDESTMPFGRYAGKEMEKIPDEYLKWFWNENVYLWKANRRRMGDSQRAVMQYIEDSFNEKDLSED